MKPIWKFTATLSSAAIFASCAVGCGNKAAEQPAAAVDYNQTATLSIGGPWDEGTFNNRAGNFIQKKFPNLTINYVPFAQGTHLQDLVAKGTVPDILQGNWQDELTTWQDAGAAVDLSPLAAKYHVDLSKFDQPLLQNIRSEAPNGQLYALPLHSYNFVLYYNKDIFNKFGVPFPKDQMTWPQALDLAKQVTKNDGQQQYRGLEPGPLYREADQYPLLSIDPKTGKANLQTDQWRNFMQFMTNVYTLPGNGPATPNLIGNGIDAFLKDKNLAMFVEDEMRPLDRIRAANDTNFNWDMVSLPTWPDAPGQGVLASGPVFGITTTCTQKDLAFQVVSYLDSDEVQLALAKEGIVPAITLPDITQIYGVDEPLLKGKNVPALFVDKKAVMPKEVSRYDGFKGFDVSYLQKALTQTVTGQADVNTALRDAEDALNKGLATAKQQQ